MGLTFFKCFLFFSVASWHCTEKAEPITKQSALRGSLFGTIVGSLQLISWLLKTPVTSDKANYKTVDTGSALKLTVSSWPKTEWRSRG